jgi:uncharacterized protein
MPSRPRHPLERPLSPRERESLWRYLTEVLAPSGGLGPEALDGFFAALVIGPDLVLPSRYLPVVKGDYEFESLEEAETLMRLLLKRWNHLARAFVDGRMPKLWLLDARPEHKGTAWCRGFREASKLRKGGWPAVQRNPALQPFIRSIEDLGRTDLQAPLPRQDRKAALMLLRDDLQNLHAAWLTARSPVRGQIHSDKVRI